MSVKRLRLPQSASYPIRIVAVHVSAGQQVAAGDPVYSLVTGNGARGVMRAPVAGQVVEGPLSVNTQLESPVSVLAIEGEALSPAPPRMVEPVPQPAPPPAPAPQPEPDPEPVAPEPQQVDEPANNSQAIDEPVIHQPETNAPAHDPLVLDRKIETEPVVAQRRINRDEPIRSVIPEDPPQGRGRRIAGAAALVLIAAGVTWMWPQLSGLIGGPQEPRDPAPEIMSQSPVNMPAPLQVRSEPAQQTPTQVAATSEARPDPAPANAPGADRAPEETSTPSTPSAEEAEAPASTGYEIRQGYVLENGTPLHGPYAAIVPLSNDLVITGRCTLRSLGNDIREVSTGNIVTSIADACATPVTGSDGLRDGSYVITTPREYYEIKCRSGVSLTPCGQDAGVIYDRRFLNPQGEVTRRCVGRDYSIFFPDFIGAEC